MQRFYTFLIAITLLASCNNPKEQRPLAASDYEQLVKQYFGHFNNHQWEKLAATYTDTADFKDPSLGPGIVKQTRQQTIDKYSALNQIFPDLHDEVIQTYPSGDKHIIVEFVSSGTAADGSKFSLPICTILTIEDGLIIKDYTYFDNFEEEKSKE